MVYIHSPCFYTFTEILNSLKRKFLLRVYQHWFCRFALTRFKAATDRWQAPGRMLRRVELTEVSGDKKIRQSFFFVLLLDSIIPCIIFRFSDGMLRFHIWCLRRTDECCRLLPVPRWGHRALFQPMFAPSWMNIMKAGRWKQCFYVVDCLCMLRIQTLMVIKARI